MTVKRIVVNIPAERLDEARAFYGELLGLSVLMDHGWIQTWGSAESMTVQLSVATEDGQARRCRICRWKWTTWRRFWQACGRPVSGSNPLHPAVPLAA